MGYKICVNLPINDVKSSMDFFKSIGWTFNYTDETAALLVISDEITAMLLTHEKFSEFTGRKIADPGTVEMTLALSVDSKAEVDRIVDAAIAAGGAEAGPPQDYGFMQQRSFHDLDGHGWVVLYLDPAQAPATA
jgi:predicted lactoylglutathione lyase